MPDPAAGQHLVDQSGLVAAITSGRLEHLADTSTDAGRDATVDGDAEVGILPTGQVVGAIDELPSVAELLERIMDSADESVRRLCGASIPQD